MHFPLKVSYKNTLACLTEALHGLYLMEKLGIEKQQLALLIPTKSLQATLLNNFHYNSVTTVLVLQDP